MLYARSKIMKAGLESLSLLLERTERASYKLSVGFSYKLMRRDFPAFIPCPSAECQTTPPALPLQHFNYSCSLPRRSHRCRVTSCCSTANQDGELQDTVRRRYEQVVERRNKAWLGAWLPGAFILPKGTFRTTSTAVGSEMLKHIGLRYGCCDQGVEFVHKRARTVCIRWAQINCLFCSGSHVGRHPRTCCCASFGETRNTLLAAVLAAEGK